MDKRYINNNNNNKENKHTFFVVDFLCHCVLYTRNCNPSFGECEESRRKSSGLATRKKGNRL